MKYLMVAMAVLFLAVYGFKLYLPTPSGTLEINSGFSVVQER